MSDAHGVAHDQLKSIVQRIERLEAEIADLNADKSEIYKEARAFGFDVKAIRKVVSQRKLDEHKREEQDFVFETYWNAVHGTNLVHAHARENIEEFDPITGEFRDEPVNAKLVKQVVDGMQTKAARAALISAVDIMIAREEAEEDPVANVEEGATSTTAAASNDPASRTDDERERQHASTVGFADDCRTGGKEQSAAAAAPAGDVGAYAEGIPATNSEKTTAVHGDAGHHSLERVSPQATANTGSADANVGGDHVTAQPAATHRAEAIVKAASAAKPLRPLCLNPGEHCGGYGSTHCGSCLRASKEEEVAA